MTPSQQQAFDSHWETQGLQVEHGQIDLAAVFPKPAPVVLEIGFGMGQSLAAMAEQYPHLNFIGIEVHKPGIGAILREANSRGLTNLRVYWNDANQVIDRCLPDASLHRVQLFFPDPWHKKRHHKRRLVQEEFVQRIRRKLESGGIFHMATDWQPYAEHMLEIMQKAPGFQNCAKDNRYCPRPEYRPITKFEKRGQRLGHGVWDLLFIRSS